MRIEILVGSKDPITFPLNSSKLTIGTAETCDIVINAHGVSRKHILVTTENDKFFVTDQGSTNGTFINEERLTPGRKTEFTSFFPLRLGDGVLVSLLADEDFQPYDEVFSVSLGNDESNRDESTRVISLKSLNSVNTENLVKRR